ncbi:MAG: SGNH/GDSL hydrolase family protein [Kiritimatiellae bacterium]|nr:SGNH/GDSL hydrolase family protein [Kiritimatiellia bacterium]
MYGRLRGMKVTSLFAVAVCTAMTAAAGPPRAASFADFDRRARAGEELSVVFFGGSLTWSANASDPNRTGFRPLVAEWLRIKYPAARFRFHDAGLGGTGSMLGIFRLGRDVFPHEPDLVFLDFACNDEGGPTALAQSCCYESILRRLVVRGVPVVQMFFTFGFWARNIDAPETGHPQLAAYRKLAEAYSTGVGDVYRDGPLFRDLRAGKVSPENVWPFDDAHPGDLGYRYFAAAGIDGFERAVASNLVCRVPETPVFGDVKNVTRGDVGWEDQLLWALSETTDFVSIAESAEDTRITDDKDGFSPSALNIRGLEEGDGYTFLTVPDGWSRKPTYRTALWFDGLSSRWMDGVAVFAGTNRVPLEVRAKANLVGVFGEADEHALVCEVRADGEKLADFRGNHGAGAGRLFIWRQALLPGWERGETAVHSFAFDPLPSPDGTGEFRIGSICTATILPAAATAPPSADAIDLERIDHGREGPR